MNIALSQTEALPVVPFVWADDSGKNCWPQRYRAVTPIAEYTVAGSEGKDNWRWYRNGYSCGSGSLIERSMRSAMDAAFEHHVATIKACLQADASA
jgi:hypothetical protein